MERTLSSEELAKLYSDRFNAEERLRKDALWAVLCSSFLQRYIPADATILDIAAGYGEFSRHIAARVKYAIDVSDEGARDLPDSVIFRKTPANELGFLDDNSVDVAFTSNFFEHLPSKAVLDSVIREVSRVLRPGGRLLAIQPNIRCAPHKYWDMYDHYLPLSDISCAEGFRLNGLEVETVIARFLPWSTKSKVPKSPFLLKCYLSLPLVWPLFGQQFFIVGRKPAHGVPIDELEEAGSR